MVEVGKPKQALDVLHIRWGQPVENTGHHLEDHSDAVVSDDQSEILPLPLVEVALLQLKVKTSIRERLQYCENQLLVFIQGVAIDKDVVKEGSIEVVEELVEYIVDQSLEVSWRIGQAKWHHQRFKKAILCLEGCLLFLPLGHLYQVIGTADVQGGEVFCLCESHQHFLQ